MDWGAVRAVAGNGAIGGVVGGPVGGVVTWALEGFIYGLLASI
jgi:hypothetical protein